MQEQLRAWIVQPDILQVKRSRLNIGGMETEFCFFTISLFFAGFYANSSFTSCLQSELISIVVTLPMSKADFTVLQDKYIDSVAAFAGVIPANVYVVSIDEISTRSSKAIAIRLLLATFVRIHTSILVVKDQETQIQDESGINFYLHQNGLPAGTLDLAVHSAVTAVFSTESFVAVTTPTPQSSEAAATSKLPLIAGCAVGGVLVIGLTIAGLFCRDRFYRFCKASTAKNYSFASERERFSNKQRELHCSYSHA